MRKLLLLALLLAPAGCEEQGSISSEKDLGRVYGVNPRDLGVWDCDPRIRVLRVAAWPGGGLQVGLEFRERDGSVPANPGALRVSLDDELGRPRRARTRVNDEAAGITAIVFVPHPNEATHRERVEAAGALLENLPSGERIGLWVADGNLTLLADVTTRREHVASRLQGIAAATGRLPSGRHLQALENVLRLLEGPWGSLSRFVIIVGSGAPVASLGDGPVAPLYLGEGTSGHRPESDSFGWAGEGTPSSAAEAAGEHIRARRSAILYVGTCVRLEQDQEIRLRVQDASCTIIAPEPEEHLESLPCFEDEIVQDEYPFVDRIELLFNASEMELFEKNAAERNKETVTARVRLGMGDPLRAKVRFRGQTAMGCERKNLRINLKGQRPSRLLPGGADDAWYLISMCHDDHYFRQVLGNRLLRSIGLFPLEHRYVHLLMNGESQGVYLLLEPTTRTLRKDHVSLDAVLRRRFHPDRDKADVDYPNQKTEIDAVRSEYLALSKVIDEVAPSQVYDELQSRMDFDNYLRWMAFNTYFQNGDYIDEMYFYGSREGSGDDPRIYFRTMAWDVEDLLKPCHRKGEFALKDPAEMLYCAEARLDRTILDIPDVRRRWMTHFEELITSVMSRPVIESHLEEIRQELFPLLQSDEVCAAMTRLVKRNPKAASCDVARRRIDENMKSFVRKVERRGKILLESIEAWRAANPASSSSRYGAFVPNEGALPARAETGELVLTFPAGPPPDTSVPILVSTSDTTPLTTTVSLKVGDRPAIPVRLYRGRGSVVVDMQGTEPVAVVAQAPRWRGSGQVVPGERPSRRLRGELSGADLRWTREETVILTERTVVPRGSTLEIGAGSTVLVEADVDLEIAGTLVASGTQAAPILFNRSGGEPWGSIRVLPGAEARIEETFLTAGGGNEAAKFGHSNSQPVVFVDGGRLVIRGGAIVDNPGKAVGSSAADVELDGVLVSRCDTGGEFVRSKVRLVRTHFLELPDGDGSLDDDDNDGIYLAKTLEIDGRPQESLVRDCVFAMGEDDGIDHNDALVSIERCWIEGFRHEGIAASNGGRIAVRDCVVRRCEQGIEAGYGKPRVEVEHCLVTNNDVGLRFGDSYDWGAEGSLRVTHTVAWKNRDWNVRNFTRSRQGPLEGAVEIRCSLVGEAEHVVIEDTVQGEVRWNEIGCVLASPELEGACAAEGLGPRLCGGGE